MSASPAQARPRIVAFVDSSVYADSVCDHAAWVAGRMSASVEVIHVLGRRQMSSAPANLSGSLSADAREHLLAELAASDEEQAKLARKRGRLTLDLAEARLVEAEISQVTTKLRIGDLVETMHEFEQGADLIVIGKRGEAADFARLHLGSNIERVVRASSRPILVASRAFNPIARVLIAFDGGKSINNAVQYLSASHHSFSGLELELLQVSDSVGSTSPELERATARLKQAGYAAKARVLSGQPDQTIANAVETEKFDMLVMGAYGHSRIRSLIIGSTTTEMIRSCKVPIVLFR